MFSTKRFYRGDVLAVSRGMNVDGTEKIRSKILLMYLIARRIIIAPVSLALGVNFDSEYI